MYLKRIILPTAEPVTLEQAMRHCRVDGYGESPAHADEPLITDLIPMARQHAEDFTGRTLAPSTWEARFDQLVGEFRLRRPPVTAVLSVKYVDTDGIEQTLDTALWVLDSDGESAVVRRVFGETWPTARAEPGAVRVQYTAGPTDGDSPDLYPLPRPIYQAMLLLIGEAYEHREDTVAGLALATLPRGAEALMRPYRTSLL